MSDRNDRCANPKCSKPRAPDREYCNEYCYRDHLQQLQDVGEFDERCDICGALPERCECSNVGMSVRDAQ